MSDSTFFLAGLILSDYFTILSILVPIFLVFYENIGMTGDAFTWSIALVSITALVILLIIILTNLFFYVKVVVAERGGPIFPENFVQRSLISPIILISIIIVGIISLGIVMYLFLFERRFISQTTFFISISLYAIAIILMILNIIIVVNSRKIGFMFVKEEEIAEIPTQEQKSESKATLVESEKIPESGEITAKSIEEESSKLNESKTAQNIIGSEEQEESN